VTSGESKLFNFQRIYLHVKIMMNIDSEMAAPKWTSDDIAPWV
jgi:hypothetical protein